MFKRYKGEWCAAEFDLLMRFPHGRIQDQTDGSARGGRYNAI